MATTKDRINISVSKETYRVLKMHAQRHQVPLATYAAYLLKVALQEIYKGKKFFL